MLINKVKRYIKHKIILSEKSTWYNNTKQRISLEHAYYLMRSFCKDAAYLNDRDVARLVILNKQHLFNILPAELNHSYQSSLTNYNEILNEAIQLQCPKKNP